MAPRGAARTLYFVHSGQCHWSAMTRFCVGSKEYMCLFEVCESLRWQVGQELPCRWININNSNYNVMRWFPDTYSLLGAEYCKIWEKEIPWNVVSWSRLYYFQSLCISCKNALRICPGQVLNRNKGNFEMSSTITQLKFKEKYLLPAPGLPKK